MSIILLRRMIRRIKKQRGNGKEGERTSVKDEVKGYVKRKFDEKVVGKMATDKNKKATGEKEAIVTKQPQQKPEQDTVIMAVTPPVPSNEQPSHEEVSESTDNQEAVLVTCPATDDKQPSDEQISENMEKPETPETVVVATPLANNDQESDEEGSENMADQEIIPEAVPVSPEA